MRNCDVIYFLNEMGEKVKQARREEFLEVVLKQLTK